MELEQAIDRCTHVPEQDLPLLAQADRHLNRADTLVNAAMALLDHADHDEQATEAWIRANELLSEAEEHVGDFDLVVENGKWHAAEAAAAEREAKELLKAQDLPSLEAKPSGLLSQADREVAGAESNLRSVSRPTASELLRGRAAEIRRRLVAAQERFWRMESH